MLILELLFVLFSIAMLGDPFRSFIRHYSHAFRDLDILEILILDLFLGGFLLYVLASVPLEAFSHEVLATLLIISVIFVGVRLARRVISIKPRNLAIHTPASTSVHFVSVVCVSLVFTLILWIELAPMTNVVLGSVKDTSLHSLFVQILINNKMIPSTHMPFLHAAIIFPQGHTVFFAFASVLLSWVPAKAVLYTTPLFIALSALGAYFLGKEISGETCFGAILAFITGFVATHPRYLTWGGNAFVVAFPFFMVCLGILFSNTRIRERTKTELLVEGLLLGYLGAIYLPIFLVVVSLLICEGIFVLAKNGVSLQNTKQYWLLLSGSILVILPNVARFLSFSSLPGSNIGLPSDVMVDLSSLAVPSPFWALETIATQPFPLNFCISSLIVFGILALAMTQHGGFEKRVAEIAVGTFVDSTILLLLASTIPWVSMFIGACTCVLIFVPLNISAAFFIYYVISTLASAQSFDKRNMKRLKMNKIIPVSALLFISLAPFIIHSVSNDEAFLTGAYNVYAVTTQDDFNLMLWMKDNLNRTSTRILVNPYDGGNFIPSVSNIVAIYPYSGSQLSSSYCVVTENLHFGKLTALEYDFMKQLNITHIFIGSKASFWWTGDHKWYARFFLDNPNFGLVRNIGEAYLFEVLCKDPGTVFQDNFNYSNLSDHRWKVCVPEQFLNAGIGSASCTTLELRGESCLEINIQKYRNASSYWYSIVKDVYLGDYAGATNNIMIRFYVKLDSNFCSKDALMIIISSGDWQQQLCFSTCKSNGCKQENFIPINPHGFNEFNLSKSWISIHGTLPPNAFHLQIACQDADGVENVAYVDNISIATKDE